MPGAVFLEGESINLRTVEEEDLETLRDIVNQRDVRRFIGHREPLNLEDEQDWFENYEGLVLTVCVDGEVVGNIALREKEPNVGEFGIMLDTEHHGNGYGTEAVELVIEHAFKQLNHHRVMARVVDTNEKSSRVWEKLGFTLEGAMREHVYMDGEFRDMKIYGLLREE
ncbi:GNAT family N-acetyltransferase [Candidatus Nanohalococcus occultus]|uniref:Acetyltransferase, RimL family n=1 Tax=Candidatus Nanohalococcus occultus TaxID=2978047 RepID=A0ABY8CKP5_9ARCH|nr:Acetyltransferase, RimL family [Candidatus Nanohaloarchaeota archaeon SVXNc]